MEANKKFSVLANEERLNKTVEALTKKGFLVVAVDDGDQAKLKTLELLPEGAEVFTLQSATTKAIGLMDEIDSSERYKSVRKALEKMGAGPSRDKAKLGSAPEIAVGSVGAITEDGTLLIASNTGSQLAADASGAGKVIFVVGSQKLVKDLDEGFQRLEEYSLPLEENRIGKLYPNIHTALNKVLVIKKEGTPERINIIIVKENLGY